jgi:DNA-binding CsgD family transcriptional regulator
MNIWRQLLVQLGLVKRRGRRYYELEDGLHTALEELAAREQRSTEEVQAELLTRALAERSSHDDLWQRWMSLSPREQDVTALTCLGYTNRQIAARLHISYETAKGYVRQLLVKFNLHSKDELRVILRLWDFSGWEPKAQDKGR